MAPPSQQRIHLSPPDVGREEADAVAEAIASGWSAPAGPHLARFEAELAHRCGRQHAVALASGTAALHLALLTLGIGPDDVVLTSTMTFAATTNAITYTGADPVLVDSDATGNIDPDLLADAAATLTREGRRVRAVLPVDLLGKVCDHAGIAATAERLGAFVVADAAESLGATRDGRPAASFGEAAAVSFNGNKIMTTSGGGALLTDDEALAHHVRYLATQARQPVVHYEHTDVGHNYRLSNLLAALGIVQLGRLDAMMARRSHVRAFYRTLFAGRPGVGIFADDADAPRGTRDNHWLTSVLVDPAVAGFGPDDLRLALEAADIESRPLWKPMHLQPVFAHLRAFTNGTSERLFTTGLSLPSGSGLDDDDLARIGDVVTAFLASR